VIDPIYSVRRLKASHGIKDHFEVSKFSGDAQPDVYDVTYSVTGALWCNCQGFRRQKYAKSLHKHVRLVKLWRERGEVPGETFRLERDGSPVFLKNVMDGTIDDPKAFDPAD
jgi:hypothetical protein